MGQFTMIERTNLLIYRVAEEQYGVVTRTGLLAEGVTTDRIRYRVRVGELRRIYRGVYLAGPLLIPRAREMAAVLACGPTSAVSHSSAMWMLGLDARRDGDLVHVLRPGSASTRIAGIRLHRTVRLEPDEVMKFEGIPITTVARTLLDIAGRRPTREMETLIGRAERARLADIAALRLLLGRHPDHPGAAKLRRLVDPDAKIAFTRSAAEAEFLKLVRASGLPAPETNVRVRGHEVDFFWRTERLVAEIDGYAYHGNRPSFESDRRRDRALAAAGVRVVRATWRTLRAEPHRLLVELTQALMSGPRANTHP